MLEPPESPRGARAPSPACSLSLTTRPCLIRSSWSWSPAPCPAGRLSPAGLALELRTWPSSKLCSLVFPPGPSGTQEAGKQLPRRRGVARGVGRGEGQRAGASLCQRARGMCAPSVPPAGQARPPPWSRRDLFLEPFAFSPRPLPDPCPPFPSRHAHPHQPCDRVRAVGRRSALASLGRRCGTGSAKEGHWGEVLRGPRRPRSASTPGKSKAGRILSGGL